jgi:hypothetical protein
MSLILPNPGTSVPADSPPGRDAFSCERSPVQTAVMSCLRRANGNFVSLIDLADWVYASDPDGGPEDARCVIAWAVLRLRARGMPIENRYTGSYRLEPLT